MTSNGLVPLIRYRDVSAAVGWLITTFGFEKRNVVKDSDGSIAYAELSYGRGIVMLGPVGQSVLDRLLKQPDELGGVGTQSVYVAVDDIEAHFKRAQNAGAEIVLEFGSEEAGDRAYAARDPEGHIWNFGAYSPWPSATIPAPEAAAEPAYAVRHTRGQAVLGAAVAALAIASVAGVATLDVDRPTPRFLAAPAISASPAPDAETAALKETLAREAHARQEAARTAAAVREELAREKAQRQAAEAARQALQKQLAERASQQAPTAAVAESAPTKPDKPAATDTAKAAPDGPAQAVTTGSIGDDPSGVELAPASQPPAPPVTVGPATPQPPAAQPAVSAPVKPAAKPRPQAQNPQAQKKRPAPKKNTGNDPLFMYD